MSVLLCLPLLLSSLPGSSLADTTDDAADISGSWSGSFQVAQYDPLVLVFHIVRDTEGLSATLDIPSQQQRGITVDRVSLLDGQLTLRVSAIQAEFYGGLQFSRDGRTVRSIAGDWAQSGEFVPLTLRPLPSTESQ